MHLSISFRLKLGDPLVKFGQEYIAIDTFAASKAGPSFVEFSADVLDLSAAFVQCSGDKRFNAFSAAGGDLGAGPGFKIGGERDGGHEPSLALSLV
jgi:hypothetical protein